MRLRVLLSLTVALLAAPAAASAQFVHTVSPGESLYSIAAADGLSVAQLAAANGLSAGTGLVTGTNIAIPPQSGFASSAAVAGSASAGDGDADSDDPAASDDAVSAASAPVSTASGGGAYVVQPGDTLWGLAARTGTTVSALAAANGLSPVGPLITGAVLGHTSGLPAAPQPVAPTVPVSLSTGAGEPVGAVAQGNAAAPPYPTRERLSGSQIGQIGANNGATWSLADAIAWQESGFNNDLVSSSDARGIMQILPGTWYWIQHSLDTGAALAPASATDNVRGGSLMLHWLLRQTGGDPALAAAGYYQGLSSVRSHGMYSDTQRYVNSVLALRRHFGGG